MNLDPEVAIYLEQCLFMDDLIPLIKKWGRFKGQRRKVIYLCWLTYIWDRQLAGQKSVQVLTYPSTYRSKYLFRPEWKQIPEVFLILRKYLLILGKSKYVWAALLQWDKYLVTKWM